MCGKCDVDPVYKSFAYRNHHLKLHIGKLIRERNELKKRNDTQAGYLAQVREDNVFLRKHNEMLRTENLEIEIQQKKIEALQVVIKSLQKQLDREKSTDAADWVHVSVVDQLHRQIKDQEKTINHLESQHDIFIEHSNKLFNENRELKANRRVIGRADLENAQECGMQAYQAALNNSLGLGGFALSNGAEPMES